MLGVLPVKRWIEYYAQTDGDTPICSSCELRITVPAALQQPGGCAVTQHLVGVMQNTASSWIEHTDYQAKLLAIVRKYHTHLSSHTAAMFQRSIQRLRQHHQQKSKEEDNVFSRYMLPQKKRRCDNGAHANYLYI